MNTVDYKNNLYNNEYRVPTFKALPKPYNVINPYACCVIKYMNNSAKISQSRIDNVIPELAGKIENVIIRNGRTQEISAWDIPAKNSKEYVLFLHGMAQNISNYQPLYKNISDKNVGVFALEYRGYGTNKSARCSEYKLSKDIKKAYTYLTKEKGIKPEDITVIGHSMGAALAVDFAKTHKDIKSLVLVAPITHLDYLTEKYLKNKTLGMGMSDFVYKLYERCSLIRWLSQKNYNTLGKIKDISTPLHIVQSSNDSVTHVGGARELAKLAEEKGLLRSCKIVRAGGHKVDSTKIDIVSDIIGKIYEK